MSVQETLPYPGSMKYSLTNTVKHTVASRAANTIVALGALLVIIGFAGCQHASPRAAAESPRRSFRLPADIAHDPGARLLFLERMRVQILQKTGGVLPSEQRATRAHLLQQLIAGGLDRQEADYILSSLDHPALAIQQASAR
jgi:hypothetical protein